MRLDDRIKTRLYRLNARMKGVRGNVDGVIGGMLVGWAQAPKAPNETLRVGLFANGAILTESPANIFRGDLEAAGIGHGHYGFSIHLSEAVQMLVAANGGIADIRTLGDRSAILGQWQVGSEVVIDPTTSVLSDDSTGLQRFLYSDFQKLSELMERPKSSVQVNPVSPANHLKLFSNHDYLSEGGTLSKEMFGYTEYIRYRDRLNEKFDTQNVSADIAHFFRRYLGAYSAMRGGLRIPLSKAALDYLNEPVIIGGQKHPFSRAMWSFIIDTPLVLKNANFDDLDWHDWALFWWVQVQAKAIHCEDCLVPDWMVDRLRAIPEGRRDDDWPITDFMRRIAIETPELAKLDRSTVAGRRDLTCALMVRAISRPDYLSFLPPASIEAAFDTKAGDAPIEAFCAQIGELPGDLSWGRYAEVMRHRQFDLSSGKMMFFTAEGHRVEYAGLPKIEPSDTPFDVQVIGPFQKASGLGQATRLSAHLLELSGLQVNKVNFGLDNPAPEGFSRTQMVQDYRSARINLIHLNAEAIPLVFAYQPDAFTDAYNIGYFFWELDTPGACHFLGMDLLDEIWVSTDYGVSIYAPSTDKPVTNVGMSFEALPEVPRDEARAALQSISGVTTDDFVFLVTFDSFSFVQRKNPMGVLTAFERAFPKSDPAFASVRLVIKTQNRKKIADPAQIEMWARVDKVLASDDRIVLVNETLSYEDLLRLKKGADAYLSLHRSEGWGFGMIEAMNLKVPVICTGYSGNMDFCNESTCWLVDYELKELGPDDYIFVRPGQKWAEPDIDHAASQMRTVFENPDEARARAEHAWTMIQDSFGEDAIAARYERRVMDILVGLGRNELAQHD